MHEAVPFFERLNNSKLASPAMTGKEQNHKFMVPG
jgi:hypothetical protein